MNAPLEPDQRDRRRSTADRRRRFRDRRDDWPRFAPGGIAGRLVRWLTGPWTSANGLSWLRLIILFVIVWWGWLSVYAIPTSSMEPTLEGNPHFWRGDRVVVNKLAFGPRVPFTKRRLISTGAPRRWDVVVFDSPSPVTPNEAMIKRVVGLPGDEVRFIRGKLYINGDPADPPPEIADAVNYTGRPQVSQAELRRRVAEFAKYERVPYDLPKEPAADFQRLRRDLKELHARVADVDLGSQTPVQLKTLTAGVSQSTFDLVETWWRKKMNAYGVPRYGVFGGPVYTLVPAGHYYCLGDNGPDSYDSRMFGWVPRENLVGRAFAIVTPVTRMRDLSGFTGTAGGLVVLFGGIALVVLWELVPGFVAFSWKLRGRIPALGLEAGDRVLVDRIGYGLRVPFTTRRIGWWRAPRAGDVVCYSLSKRRGPLDLYFGEVKEVTGAPEPRYIVRGPGDGEERWFALRRRDIVGRARMVWWPRRRRGRIRMVSTRPGDHAQAGPVESD